MNPIHDLRHGLRWLAGSPGFTVAVVVTLALAIGANAAVFSVVDGVLLRPPPLPEPDRLVVFARPVGPVADGADVSIPDGADWRAASRTLDGIALLLRDWAFDLVGEGEPRRLHGVVAEPELFEVLGLEPVLGRPFTAEDNVVGGEPVALISSQLWQSLFAGDPEVVGRTLQLSGKPVTVLGVMPPQAGFLGDRTDLWVPVAVETPWAMEERGTNNFDAVARLAPGATLEQAQAEMEALSERLAAEYPRTNRGKIVRPLSLTRFAVGEVRPALLTLLGAVALVLLIAAANLAGMMLARSTARRPELALRLALGAGRRRLLGQLLTEGLLLAAAGGALGLLLAVWLQEGLLALAPASLPRAGEVAIDDRVLAFTFAVTLATGLLFSLVPAVELLSRDAGRFLSTGGRTAGREPRRLHRLLVVTEVAVAFMLLIGCGLLLRTYLNLTRVELGFEPARVLTANVVLPEARYGERQAQTAFFEAAVEELAALPGVQAATSVIGLPLESSFQIGNRLLVEGRPPATEGGDPGARSRPVTGDYFRTLDLPLLAGRAFTAADDERGRPVAIVNQLLARQLWPGASPLRRRIAWRPQAGQPPRWMTVVGVAADVEGAELGDGDSPAVYTPYAQRDVDWQRFAQLAVRTSGDPRTLARAMQEAVWRVDSSLPLTGIGTMEERRAAATARERFSTLVLAVFGFGALLLAVQGIYALLAFGVERRRRELGVRMALGAERRDLVRMVVRQGMVLAAVGLGLGAAGAVGCGRLLRSLLFELSPVDGATYLVAAAVLAAAALFGGYLPARRAARIDPMVALRSE